MIYLSWSVAKLAMHILVMIVGYAVLMWKGKEHRALISKMFAGLLALTLYDAFDVGTRQADLQRSSFDAAPPVEQQAKTERITLDRNAVKQTFEQAVKETK